MNLEHIDSKTLRVRGLQELTAGNAAQVRDEIRLAIRAECTRVEIDLSEATFVDSSGLGALIAVHKTLRARQGTLCILRPTAAVQQLLELTRLHRLFEIAQG